MKKFLILLVAICCCGCGSIKREYTETADTTKIKYYSDTMGCYVYTMEIEGHIYIIYSGIYKGGIIHAEHCPCKMK